MLKISFRDDATNIFYQNLQRYFLKIVNVLKHPGSLWLTKQPLKHH